MTAPLLAAVAASGFLLGVVLGHRTAVASRTYRDARSTARNARSLWRQVPRDWARVVRLAAALVGLVVAAVMGFRAGR